MIWSLSVKPKGGEVGPALNGLAAQPGKDRRYFLESPVLPSDDIETRRTGPSALPDDLQKKLTRRELRDLVEFLVSLKEEMKEGRR